MELYTFTNEKEENLWNDAVFVFDTSSVLEIYSCVNNAQQTIMKILEHFKDRIWIPAQVKYEYMKHRDEVLLKPISEKYKTPKGINLDLVNSIDDFLKKTNDEYYHPYIDNQSQIDISTINNELKERIEKVIKIQKQQYEKRKKEIKEVINDDIIYQTFMQLTYGVPFSYQEILEIIKEGEFRYRNGLPPGYMDDEKSGVRLYGDLIIWKEIIKYASANNKSIILISNDVKDDWYLKENKDKKITLEPRHELIKEFNDETGQNFWMYPIKDFISKLEEKFVDTNFLPLFSNLENVLFSLGRSQKEALHSLRGEDSFTIKCSHCDAIFEVNESELNFDWECVGSDERSMGVENQYNSIEYLDCPECGNSITLTLEVWEYPVGAYNYHDHEIEGGEVIEDFDFSNNIDFNDPPEFYPCEKCGTTTYDDEHLCSSCKQEFESKMADE